MTATAVVPSRDLRNRTAEILRRVEAGEEIEVLHHNRRVARLVPVRERRRWIPAAEVARQLKELGADTTDQLAELRDALTDTTDDLRW